MEKLEWEIAWSDSLSVGVPAMDDEHRQFISRVNELNRAIIESEDKTVIERSMNRMLMQAADHFEHEEELLNRLKFPQLASHKAKHAELMAQFDRVVKEVEASTVSYIWARKALHLKQLLIDHLTQEDMMYRDFMRAQDGPN